VGLAAVGCATVAGPEQTQTRTIAAVGTVELSSSGDLVLTQGAAPLLRITAGENVIGHLTSSVHGDRLTLGSDGSLRVLGRVTYDLVLPAARTVDLSGSGAVHVAAPSALQRVLLPGSGTVRIEGLRSESLTVDLSGSGQIAVAGGVTRQQVSIGGSGRYSAGGLASQDAVVTIGGSGTADVSADRTLAASISGSGTITYTGNAAVTTSVTGSGSVVHR
jgi:hypothetical protein